MSPLWIRVRAPFAAYRHFQAGTYRASCPTLTPTAAWGMLLNFAGIETRRGEGPVTEISADAPKLKIATGAIEFPEKSTLYQQLHSYPVGNSGKEHSKRTFGNKYWIAPIRRELLVGLDVMLGVEAEDRAVLEQIRLGVRGETSVARYGLPFAGDNNLLIDRVDFYADPHPAYWYTPVQQADGPRAGSSRMTVLLDRTDSSKTKTVLFAPALEKTSLPPDSAWTLVPAQR